MEIRCDTEGCCARIVVDRDITQYTAGIIALETGWQVTHGSSRDYHHCPEHREDAPAASLGEVTL